MVSYVTYLFGFFDVPINDGSKSIHVHVLQQFLRIFDPDRHWTFEIGRGLTLLALLAVLLLGLSENADAGGLLLTLEAIPDGARAHQSKALAQNPAGRHVLLGLEVGKVERGSENEDVGHGHETLEKGYSHLDGHALSRLEHVQLVVGRRGRGEQGQEAAASDDQVVGQLGDQVHRVDEEDAVFGRIYEVEDGFGRVRTPNLNVSLEAEEDVGQESLVNIRPAEFRNAERRSRRTGTELRLGFISVSVNLFLLFLMLDLLLILSLSLVLFIDAVKLQPEFFIRDFGVHDGQSVDPNTPTAEFVFDGVVQKRSEKSEDHIRESRLVLIPRVDVGHRDEPLLPHGHLQHRSTILATRIAQTRHVLEEEPLHGLKFIRGLRLAN